MKNSLKYFSIITFIILVLLGCNQTPKEWKFKEKIMLNGINPLGILVDGKGMWLSDVDRNRLVHTDMRGNIDFTQNELQRPMHISMENEKVFIPEFLDDRISTLSRNLLDSLQIDSDLDAPAGIDISGNVQVIVDFYNHQLVLVVNGKTSIIGEKGHADGELNYPTDVALYGHKIFVADAYNNRVQVFDYEGNVLKVIGWQEKIRVAAGLTISENRVFVTDFHGNRVLIYDFDGQLIKILEEQFDRPTDVYVLENILYVANYKGGFISVFKNE